MSKESDERAKSGSSEDTRELVARAASRLQEALEDLRAAEAASGLRSAEAKAEDDDKHPHEPPTLITDGSFIIECDEPLDAAGDGGLLDPLLGTKRKKFKRRPSASTGDPHIACVIVEGGVRVSDRKFKFTSGDCKIKIFWETHPCDEGH